MRYTQNAMIRRLSLTIVTILSCSHEPAEPELRNGQLDNTHSSAFDVIQQDAIESGGTESRHKQAPSDPEKRPLALILTETQGYYHASIAPAVAALSDILLDDGFTVQQSESSSVFMQGLAHVSVLIFLSTTGDILSNAEQTAVRTYVQAGGGWVGIHAAADAEYEWPWYEQLVGAWFAGHPPVQEANIRVNQKHAATSMLPLKWTRTDEWYDFSRPPPSGATVLLWLESMSDTDGSIRRDHPIAWAQSIGQGRSLYTGGGHTEESYHEPLFREHLLASVRWAARLEP